MIFDNVVRKIHWIALFCAMWMLFFQGVAQDRMSLTLEESIQYALSNNKEVQNARFDEYIAQARVKEIIANGYPQISATADLQYFVELPTQILPGFFNPKVDPTTGQPVIDPVTGEPVPGDPLEVQFGFPWQSNAGVQVNQLIADGVFFLGLKAAKTYVEISEVASNRTQEQTALQVSKAYYQALIAKEQLSILDANLARIQRLFDETKALNQEGFVEKIDVDRLQINLTNLEVEREKVVRFVAMGKNLLKFQMGLPIATDIELTEAVEDHSSPPSLIADFSTFNLENRVEYRLLQSQKKLEGYNIQRIKAGRYPSLYAFGSYQYNAQRDDFSFFDSNQKWFPISVVGLQLNVPIFSGFRLNAQHQQSQIALKKLDNQAELLQNSIYLELSNSQSNLQNAYESLARFQDNIELAQKVFSVTQIKYKEGVGSSIEVNEAENQLKEAESHYLNGLFEYLMAQLDWQKAQGQFSKYHVETE
ncbi:MAG: TolC family protein [Bacteroidota bacterium]